MFWFVVNTTDRRWDGTCHNYAGAMLTHWPNYWPCCPTSQRSKIYIASV